MRIDFSRVHGVLVVTPQESSLDAHAAPSFKEQVGAYVDEGRPAVVLDLGQLTSMDSSGLGAVVSVFKRLGSDGQLVIANAEGVVLSVFKLTRMDRIFRIVATREEALRELTAPPVGA